MSPARPFSNTSPSCLRSPVHPAPHMTCDRADRGARAATDREAAEQPDRREQGGAGPTQAPAGRCAAP